MTTLWLAIIAIGALTCAMRIAPLFLAKYRKQTNGQRPAWLDALGPCLLSAMATVVILPYVQSTQEGGLNMATAVAFGVVAIIMLLRRDPGLATIGGVLAYFLLS